MERFLCWLRFGHIWVNLGMLHKGTSTMYQCQHCCLTVVLDNVTGDVK